MALSIVWTAMAAASLIFSVFVGSAPEVSAAVMDGAVEAAATAIAMAGPVCLWSGVCSLMEASGISATLSRFMAPLLSRLFPEFQKDRSALQSISGCVIANLLGLGNAATPLGIQAVKRMAAMQKDPTVPSNGMCRFIVLNTASIQLIPTTVAALRASLGSASPFDILPAVWITSILSVCTGLCASWLLGRCGRKT